MNTFCNSKRCCGFFKASEWRYCGFVKRYSYHHACQLVFEAITPRGTILQYISPTVYLSDV